MGLSLLIGDDAASLVIHSDDKGSVKSNGKVILIDPGHGGHDDGGVVGNVKEKDLTLQVGKQLGEILIKRGYTVAYTRESDMALGMDEVEDLSLRVNMEEQQNADLMISLHTNYADEEINERCYGYEIYTNPADAFGMEAANHMDRHLQKLHYTMSRGVRDGSIFQIIQLNERSAILVEMGFLDDDADRTYLSDSQGQKRIALAIADALDDTFGFGESN